MLNFKEADKFRELLDESYQWPDFYDFKFIIKETNKEIVREKLMGFALEETPSKKGTYVSINARKLMKSSQDVLDVYERMSTVKGVISL